MKTSQRLIRKGGKHSLADDNGEVDVFRVKAAIATTEQRLRPIQAFFGLEVHDDVDGPTIVRTFFFFTTCTLHDHVVRRRP